MVTRRNAIVACFAAAALLALAPTPAVADAGAEPLAIVASKQSSLTDLSLYQLKRLYLGDAIQGPGGAELVALNRDAKGAERSGFDKNVLGMTPDAAARYWIDRRIRGQSGAPKAVEPAAVLQRVVSNLPNAVAYVRLRDVSPDVRIVKIDGRKPGDAGYPVFAASGPVARSGWRWPLL
jgi:hypothetical protein